MPAEPPAILSAKLSKLAAIIEDGNDTKRSPPGSANADDVRAEQSAAVRDVLDAGGSVAAVERIELPSERVE